MTDLFLILAALVVLAPAVALLWWACVLYQRMVDDAARERTLRDMLARLEEAEK